MARSISVFLLGNANSLVQAFDRAEAKALQFERTMGRSSKATKGGASSFLALGKSLGLITAGTFGLQKLGEFLKDSTSEALQAQAQDRQLAQQLKQLGIEYGSVSQRIRDTDEALMHVSGFTVPQLTRSFTTLVRATGDTNDALRLNKIAADVARGTGKSLQLTAIAIGKAWTGQTTALKRLGIALPAGVSGFRAINIVAERFAGQAEAGTTSAQHLHAELVTLEETVGKLVVPSLDVLNKYLATTVQGIGYLLAPPEKGSKLGFLSGEALHLGGVLDWLNKKSSFIPGGLVGLLNPAVGLGFVLHDLSKAPKQAPDVGDLFNNAAAPFQSFLTQIRRFINKPSFSQLQNTQFDARVSRQLDVLIDLPTLKQQNAAMRQVVAELQVRVNLTKDATRKLKLSDQIRTILRSIRQNNESMAADAKALAQQQAADAEAAAQAAKTEALGWADFGIEKAGATKTLKDDLAAENAKLALLRKWQKAGDKSLDTTRLIWETEQERAALLKKMTGTQQNFKRQSADKFIDSLGLGLTTVQQRQLAAGIAARSVGGKVPVQQRSFGGGAVIINGGLHLHGVQNMTDLENEFHKRAAARPQVRRGAR
jgi:hypothetical protein